MLREDEHGGQAARGEPRIPLRPGAAGARPRRRTRAASDQRVAPPAPKQLQSASGQVPAASAGPSVAGQVRDQAAIACLVRVRFRPGGSSIRLLLMIPRMRESLMDTVFHRRHRPTFHASPLLL